MGAAKKSCVKCEEAMERGYITRPWIQAALQVEIWIAGRPMTPANFGTKPKERKPLVVMSWRCTGCGFLESYAG